MPVSQAPNIRERRFKVDHNFEGWRLDKFLASRIPRLSRTRAGEIARFGDVELLPPRRAKPSLRLLIGDTVIVREHLPPETLQDGEVKVLHRDEGLIILNKPAGMLVHETPGQRLNTAEGYLERAGFCDAQPVHRLDRETSGILVCAAARSLVPSLWRQFSGGGVEKQYRALVLDPDHLWTPGVRATIDTPLGLDPSSAVRVRMSRGPLKSRTHVEVFGRRVDPTFGPMADLSVKIETGRQHQIRVHLALEGTPVAGDKLYTHGDAFFSQICDDPHNPELLSRLPFGRQALHAWRLSLADPITGEALSFEAPLPGFWCA